MNLNNKSSAKGSVYVYTSTHRIDQSRLLCENREQLVIQT